MNPPDKTHEGKAEAFEVGETALHYSTLLLSPLPLEEGSPRPGRQSSYTAPLFPYLPLRLCVYPRTHLLTYMFTHLLIYSSRDAPTAELVAPAQPH